MRWRSQRAALSAALLALAVGLLVVCRAGEPEPSERLPSTSPTSPTSPTWADEGATPAERGPSLQDLVGTWQGRAEAPGRGPVLARLTVTAGGWVFASATVQGVTIDRRLRLQSWDGKILRVRLEGSVRELPATLRDKELEVDLPVVGAVTLVRD